MGGLYKRAAKAGLRPAEIWALHPSEILAYCEAVEEQKAEEREWENFRVALIVSTTANAYAEKKVSPFDVFHMPNVQEAIDEGEAAQIDDRIIGMYKQGLIDENHSLYGEKIKAWLEKSQE